MSDPSQEFAADRKVVLMRLLAVEAAAANGCTAGTEEIQDVARWWRRQFDLTDDVAFLAWLRGSGLDLAQFSRLMGEFAAVHRMLELRRDEINARLVDHLAIHTVHARSHPCGT